MSILPEYLLQTVIVRGIKTLRSDSRLIDQLFRNLSAEYQEQIRTFIKTQAFDLAINYPRTTLKVPAIVLLLKSENESQAFLADSMGISVPDELSYDGPSGELLGGVGSVTSLSGNPTIEYGPDAVVSATLNTLTADATWAVDRFLVGSFNVRIVAGRGSGQVRQISGNSRTTLMVAQNWRVIPDNTSVYEIIQPPIEVVGEPTSSYDRQNPPAALERLGGIYEMVYQIQVVTQTPELSIALSIILKSIFTQSRIFLEGQGLMDFMLRASDLTARPEYVPDFAYLRGLEMTFKFHFDTYVDRSTVARSFHLLLEGQPDGSILGVPVLAETSWDTTQLTDTSPASVINSLIGANRVYFSAASPPTTINHVFVQDVLGTEGTGLATTGKRTIEFLSGPGQLMYYALPSRFGIKASDFLNAATGLVIPFTLAATLPLTTGFGTENFDVWASASSLFGITTVLVN